MPYLTMKLMEGRSIETKEKLVYNMTKAITESLEIEPSDVRIELIELKKGFFAKEGKLVRDND
ncbi:tautomerase family protein [Sporosarcina sp. 179-K 3D1 HS]|uniref:tautomerase family protein n=1 Tax=Sporosarcina sp. 179-K 3D1 HS TaxID=3232169 RepID=UPI0039A02ED2